MYPAHHNAVNTVLIMLHMSKLKKKFFVMQKAKLAT